MMQSSSNHSDDKIVSFIRNPITNENFDESIISSPATTTTQSSMADNEDIIDIDGDDDTQASNRRYRYTNAMLNNSENHKH